MNKNKLRVAVIVVIFLQFALVVGSVLSNELKLRSADEIIVRLAPLDPRSLIQGDYVILAYSFERDARKELRVNASESLRFPNNTVHVLLTPQDGEYIFKDISVKKIEEIPLGDIVLKGKVARYSRINFGIENFFVEENTGREVERNARFAKLKVTSSGEAFVVDLLEELP